MHIHSEGHQALEILKNSTLNWSTLEESYEQMQDWKKKHSWHNLQVNN